MSPVAGREDHVGMQPLWIAIVAAYVILLALIAASSIHLHHK
jgi:hypothetical protein